MRCPVAKSESASESRCASRAIVPLSASAALAYQQRRQKLYMFPAHCFRKISTKYAAHSNLEPLLLVASAAGRSLYHAISPLPPLLSLLPGTQIDMACWWRIGTAEMMLRILLTERLA